MPDHDDLPYDDGGVLKPGSHVRMTLAPDECVLARRDGTWVCVREHDHGDQ